jgi:hypothetical protein
MVEAPIPTIYIVGGVGTGVILLTPTMYYSLDNIQAIPNYPIGTFQVQPTILQNGGGVINIVATMNGANTIVTGFTLTNGGYTRCFSSPPTIVLSGTGYAPCTWRYYCYYITCRLRL